MIFPKELGENILKMESGSDEEESTPTSLTSEAGFQLAKRIFLGNGKYNVYIIEFIRSGKLKHKNGDVHFQKLVCSMNLKEQFLCH